MEESLLAHESEKFWKERKNEFKESIMEVMGPDQNEYRTKTSEYKLDMTWVAIKRYNVIASKPNRANSSPRIMPNQVVIG